jgi:hypothetical protein
MKTLLRTILILCLLAASVSGQSKFPIKNGILQSDLQCAGFKLLSANLSDYAGTGLTWNVSTNKFDATGGGGGAPTTSGYITKTPDATLTNEFALSTLATGLLKNTTTTGVPTIAIAGTDYEAALGNPSVNGYLLSSTTAGTRSWVAPASGSTIPTGTGFYHVTGGAMDAASRAVDVSTADITGNMAHTHLASGTGASSTTFWRGDDTWAVPAGGTGAPGGSNFQLQYNNSGAFGGIASATYTVGTGALSLRSAGTNQNLTIGGSGTGQILIPTTGAASDNSTINFGAFYNQPALILYDGGVANRWGWGLRAGDMQFFGPAPGPGFMTWNKGGDFQVAGTNELMRLDLTNDYLILGSTSGFQFSSTTVSSGTADTGMARNAAGVVEINNGTLNSYATLKDSVTNATTGFQLGGLEFPIAANGIVKRTAANAYSAAAAGTDYVAPGGALGTPSSGTLTNCTFPTLNQNTTGSAATLTTSRTINGVGFNGSANIVSPAIGANRTIVVSNGTTWGASTETYAVPGTSGNVMKSDGTNWTSAAPTGGGDMLLGTVQTVTAAKTFNSATLLYAGATSGTTTLNAMAIAGTGTCTLPTQGNVMASGTVVTATVDQTATTETAHVVYTVPANTCTAGTSFRITAFGNIDNGTTAITYTPNLRWGGTGGVSLQSLPVITSTTTALANRTWKIEAVVTVRTIGASGTAVSEMALSNHTASSTGVYAQDEANSLTTVTIDTTANKDLDLTWTMNLSTGTPHVRTLGGFIEIVKN